MLQNNNFKESARSYEQILRDPVGKQSKKAKKFPSLFFASSSFVFLAVLTFLCSDYLPQDLQG